MFGIDGRSSGLTRWPVRDSGVSHGDQSFVLAAVEFKEINRSREPRFLDAEWFAASEMPFARFGKT